MLRLIKGGAKMITKQGAGMMSGLYGAAKSFQNFNRNVAMAGLRGVRNVGKATAVKGAKGLGAAAKVTTMVGLKGAGAVGKAIGKNPMLGIPALGLAAYTGYKLPGTLRKQRAFVDPAQHSVYREPVSGKLRYRDTSPGFKANVQYYNRFV
jgi:hypothetical protein